MSSVNTPVVVGVDGSESALHAVRWAAGEARRRHVGLRLVHAFGIPVGYAPGFVDWHALHEALVARGRTWLEEARQAAEETAPGVATEVVEVKAGAVPALLRESAHTALVVLGTRGLGGFAGLVIGSTAVELAAYAHCPVVVARGADPGAGPVVVGVDGTPVGETAIAFAFAAASARGTSLVAVHTWTDLVLEAAFAGGAAALDFAPLAQQAEEWSAPGAGVVFAGCCSARPANTCSTTHPVPWPSSRPPRPGTNVPEAGGGAG